MACYFDWHLHNSYHIILHKLVGGCLRTNEQTCLEVRPESLISKEKSPPALLPKGWHDFTICDHTILTKSYNLGQILQFWPNFPVFITFHYMGCFSRFWSSMIWEYYRVFLLVHLKVRFGVLWFKYTGLPQNQGSLATMEFRGDWGQTSFSHGMIIIIEPQNAWANSKKTTSRYNKPKIQAW